MREIGKQIPSHLAGILLVAATFAIVLPVLAYAQYGSGNKMCIGENCPCMMGGPECKDPGNGKIGCFCKETANGKTTPGSCVSVGICEAKATSEGKSPMDPSKLMEALKQLMDALKGKDKGGGDKDQPPSQNPDPCIAGGQTFAQINRDKPENSAIIPPIPVASSTPCIPGGSSPFSDPFYGGLGGAGGYSSLADLLLGKLGATASDVDDTDEEESSDEEAAEEEEEKVSDTLSGVSGEGDDEDTEDTKEESGGGGEDVTTPEGAVALEGRLEGDIYVGDAGGTIFARSRDPGSNTEVAGFYGGGSAGPDAAKSLIGRMCVSRPWSGGFLSSIIPPSFFDGLCTRAGYQVGPLVKESSGPATKRATKTAPTKKTTTVKTPVIKAEVDIWAEPGNVRLGTRTYIFWNSSGVVSCKASGPSFSQNSLSGGASTVPLSDASTFKISCLTAASTTVEDSVTVRLAL